MTVSPFDHPLLSALLGDEETARQFSAESELAAMLAFERALAEAEAAEGIIDQAAADAIAAALASFSPDMDKLRAGVARDGVVGARTGAAVARRPSASRTAHKCISARPARTSSTPRWCCG